MTIVYTLEAEIVYGDENDERSNVRVFNTLAEATEAGKQQIAVMIKNYGLLDEDDTAESIIEDWESDKQILDNWDDMPRYVEFVVDHHMGEASVCIRRHVIPQSKWIVEKKIWTPDPSGETDQGGWMSIIYHDSPTENRNVPLGEEEAWYIFMSLGPMKGDTIVDSQINHLYERWWVFETPSGRQWKTIMKQKEK